MDDMGKNLRSGKVANYSTERRTCHSKIVKEGNRWLRWAVVKAVYSGIKADFDIKRFSYRLKKRKKRIGCLFVLFPIFIDQVLVIFAMFQPVEIFLF
jgi:hypothetical protein